MPAKRRSGTGGKPRSGQKKAKRAKPADLRSQLAQHRSLEALQGMRSRGLSLAQAAKHAGTTPRTMQRHVGKALMRKDDGRYAATKWDRIPRTMRFLTENGVIDLVFRDSRTASDIARYMSAVDRYLRTGDREPLSAFRGKVVKSGKTAHAYITNGNVLERLAYAGEVSFEDLYSFTTGETK